MESFKTGFIGCGNMASAIIGGMEKAGFTDLSSMIRIKRNVKNLRALLYAKMSMRLPKRQILSFYV